MALSDIKFARQRQKRRSLGTIRGLSPSSQLMRTTQTVSPTGASVAIRPRVTAIRRMDNKGAGEVGYF